MSNSIKEQSKFGRFNVLTLTKDQASSQYLSDDTSYICLMPFEKTLAGGIKSVYLLQFPNHSLGKVDCSLIIDPVNEDLDRTQYDSVCRSLIEEAGINIDDYGLSEDHIFYLGDITLSTPVSAKMHCFGIDLTGPKSQPEFTRTLSKDSFTKDDSTIIKAGFHEIVNGNYSDATVLAGSFLLISYFNS